MRKNMKDDKYFEDILQSDDELPLDYEDKLFTPAYKMDNRFEPIKYSWVDSNFSKYYQKISLQSNANLPGLYKSLNEDILCNKTNNQDSEENTFILNRVLALQDIYCLKSIESSTSDAVFLWLINFLLYKDMQSRFSYLKTCLATLSDNYDDKHIKDSDFGIKNYNYDLLTNLT